MFSLSTSLQPQVTVQLSHLINALHSLKGSVSHKHRENIPEHELNCTECCAGKPSLTLRDLGLTDLGVSQLDELVQKLLPCVTQRDSLSQLRSVPNIWRTSHLSSDSFFHNKHGFTRMGGVTPVFSKPNKSPLQTLCTDLKYLPCKGFLTRDKVSDVETLDKLLKNKNIPDGQHDAFKTGFAEGFLKAQALTQRNQGNVNYNVNYNSDSAIPNHIRPGLSSGPCPDEECTGKTLLARAVAGEADVPFYYASGSEFDEMFVGVGASRIRNLFREAKANAPCVIFIDELDSVGGKRIESPMHPYSRQTINQLLAEMDGALIRPGRFDMQVTVPMPDVKGRTEILKWYLKKIKVDSAVEAMVIARGTVGFSGAELENLVNQAALKAAVDGKDMVTMKELEFAKDKILMGPERRSADIDKKNKEITAYHESGHAIIAYYTKDAMPINKATIMPRGPTLGHVSMLPENDRWSETRAQLLAQIDVSMGGRVAEELIFGSENITTGASSDFDSATKIAKMMVTKFGMSEKLGVMTYADLTKQSPETQAAIENEVRILLRDSYERAKVILKSRAKEHKNLAEALLQYETLDAKEIQLVLEGKAIGSR
ncbi:hypothetical protein cypCar_00019450 [Cyprinus carpio]|nr:hypothetical protein cypCar_00019450 [Cyprinus carpio]